jgi:cytoskeletal protein CcmA (bactofilin family)
MEADAQPQPPPIDEPVTVLNVFGEDSRLSGEVSGQDFTILGHFDGTLRATGRLRIGPAAVVRARVTASSVEIDGDFEGEVRSDLLRFSTTARAKGVFLADRLSLQDGARVNGPVNLPAAPATAPAEVPAPSPGEPEANPPSARVQTVSITRRSSVGGRKGRGRGRRRPGRLSAVASAAKKRGRGRQFRLAVPARRAFARK